METVRTFLMGSALHMHAHGRASVGKHIINKEMAQEKRLEKTPQVL